MNQTAEAILNSDEYFRCERYLCTMKKDHCIERQKTGLVRGYYTFRRMPGALECRECEQGRKLTEVDGGKGDGS